MLKTICDICDKEISIKELPAQFIIAKKTFGIDKKTGYIPQITTNKYDMCEQCGVKVEVAITKLKEEKNNGD